MAQAITTKELTYRAETAVASQLVNMIDTIHTMWHIFKHGMTQTETTR